MELRTVATPGDAHDHEDAPLLMGERAAARPRAAPQTLNVVAMGRVAAVALTVATISALLTVVLPVSLSGPGGATGDQPVARHHGGTMATSLFSGNKVRQYTGRRLFSGADQFKPSQSASVKFAASRLSHPDPTASKWVVITTIFPPTDLVRQLDKHVAHDDTCVVVVGDEKSPRRYGDLVAGSSGGGGAVSSPVAAADDDVWDDDYAYYQDDEFAFTGCVVYLDVARQKDLMFSSLAQTPWNHFARKNIGYLYAIAHGADTIYDTDDDNDLIDPTSAADLPTVPPRVTRSVAVNRQCAVPIVNMLSLFGASEENTWPRGYPLELIREQDSLCGAVDANDADDGEVDDVWLWQSLANYDPDVDAVYRLTRPIPFSFAAAAPDDAQAGGGVRVRPGTFTPYNAQSTLHLKRALWCAYLPISVHGRVSDIWRSYVCQKLFWSLGGAVGYHAPRVEQYRNDHNYLSDFRAEEPLYSQAAALTTFLASWAPPPGPPGHAPEDFVPSRMEALYVEMYERDFIEVEDIAAVQAWLTDLRTMGHGFTREEA